MSGAEITFLDDEGYAEDTEADCWRCGRLYALDAPACPACRAPRVRSAQPPKHRAERSGLVRVLAVFAVLLATSIVHRVVALAAMGAGPPGPAAIGTQLDIVIGVEVFDAVLVVAALFWIPRPPRPPRRGLGRRLGAWALALPLLAGALAINVVYHAWVRDQLQVPQVDDEVLAAFGWTPRVIFAYCVQPAFIEELFFRHLALDTLGESTGPHASVFISSTMFALAHLGAPLSMPVLFVIGMSLGYARLAGGGLLVPMAMHAAHNAIVMSLN